MSKSGRIIIALAIGGILGMLVALKVPYLVWWLGALAGGLIAGFIYALPDIIRYAPTASRTAWHSLTYAPKVARTTGNIFVEIVMTILFLFGLRPKMPTSERLMVAIIWLALVLLIWGGFFILTYSFPGAGESMLNPLLFVIIWTVYCVYISILIIREMWSNTSIIEPDPLTNQKKVQMRKRTLFYVTPLGLVFLVGWGLAKISPAMGHLGWESGKFIVKFTRTLFILVHSKDVVLVSIDGVLGVAAIYLLFVRQGEPALGVGPTLVLGGFVSVLLGCLDYLVVSRRVLHLKV